MMNDWDSDPEFKALREEFIDSFKERRLQLEAALAMQDFKQVIFVSHKLAGAAESYGFPALTEVGAALEDCLVHAKPDFEAATRFGTLLAEMILAAENNRVDPANFRDDPRLQQLLSAAASGH